jgi:hypothetical protein
MLLYLSIELEDLNTDGIRYKIWIPYRTIEKCRNSISNEIIDLQVEYDENK